MPVRLPYDLEEEIFSRVPLRSLARLRCVCKAWNSLILDEGLIKKNLSRMHNSYSGEHRFIVKDRGPNISAVGIEEHQNVVDPPSLIIQDLTLRKVRPDVRPIALYNVVHCDGLLLVVMDTQLLVWNPLLKETTWIKCGSDFHRFNKEKSDAENFLCINDEVNNVHI